MTGNSRRCLYRLGLKQYSWVRPRDTLRSSDIGRDLFMVHLSAAKLGFWDREEAVVLGGHDSSSEGRLRRLSQCACGFPGLCPSPDVRACLHRISSAPEEQVLLNTGQWDNQIRWTQRLHLSGRSNGRRRCSHSILSSEPQVWALIMRQV